MLNRNASVFVLLGVSSMSIAPLAVAGLDTAGIERGIGLPGQPQGDVFKVSIPRRDLSVEVDGLRLQCIYTFGQKGRRNRSPFACIRP